MMDRIMSREILLDLWTQWWDNDIWITPWSKAIDGLTAAQAAWKPGPPAPPDRHSIWQNITHVMFWRTYTLNVIAGKPKPTDKEIDAANWGEPARLDEAAWSAAKAALKDSHERIRAALADPNVPMDRTKHHLVHDAYHMGQIMQLRGLQGLKAIV